MGLGHAGKHCGIDIAAGGTPQGKALTRQFLEPLVGILIIRANLIGSELGP